MHGAPASPTPTMEGMLGGSITRSPMGVMDAWRYPPGPIGPRRGVQPGRAGVGRPRRVGALRIRPLPGDRTVAAVGATQHRDRSRRDGSAAPLLHSCRCGHSLDRYRSVCSAGRESVRDEPGFYRGRQLCASHGRREMALSRDHARIARSAARIRGPERALGVAHVHVCSDRVPPSPQTCARGDRNPGLLAGVPLYRKRRQQRRDRRHRRTAGTVLCASHRYRVAAQALSPRGARRSTRSGCAVQVRGAGNARRSADSGHRSGAPLTPGTNSPAGVDPGEVSRGPWRLAWVGGGTLGT